MRSRRYESKRRGRGALGLLSFLVRSALPHAIVLSAPSLSLAQEPSDFVVVVSAAAKPDERSTLLEALREPLDSLGLTLRVAHTDDAPSPLVSAGARARVWIDARPADHVDIFVWTVQGEPFAPAHRVIPRSGSPAVIAEEVAYVVRATLESLLSEPPPPSVAPPPSVTFVVPPQPRVDAPAVPPPPPIRRTSARFGLDISAFGAAQVVAPSTPAFGGGLGLDLAFRGAHPFRPTLWLDASLNAPFESMTAEATLETTVYSVRVVPGLELFELGRFHLALGAGPGVDLLHTVPSAGSMPFGVNVGASSFQADPIVEAQLLFHAPLARNAGIVLGLNVDYDVAPHHYVETNGLGVTSTVFAPWDLRPSAILGLCVPLVGDSACAGLP